RELDDPPRALDAQPGGVPEAEELGAQAPRLRRRSLGELGAAQARRKPEVVLDPARLAGLTPGSSPLDHDRLQALGRAVHGGGEASGATADDHEIVVLKRGLSRNPEPL